MVVSCLCYTILLYIVSSNIYHKEVIPTSVVHEIATLKTWGFDYNSTKFEIFTNFICSNNKGVVITVNKTTLNLDLKIIKNYFKNIENVNSVNISYFCLLQSKSWLYLKILEILYLLNNSNLPITSNIIKEIIKSSHLFNNVTLVSQL